MPPRCVTYRFGFFEIVAHGAIRLDPSVMANLGKKEFVISYMSNVAVRATMIYGTPHYVLCTYLGCVQKTIPDIA